MDAFALLLLQIFGDYMCAKYASVDMDISIDIQKKSVDMDMDGKFHIHGKPDNRTQNSTSTSVLHRCTQQSTINCTQVVSMPAILQ